MNHFFCWFILEIILCIVDFTLSCSNHSLFSATRVVCVCPAERILLIHAGGFSQRLPHVSVLGKAFGLVPIGKFVVHMFRKMTRIFFVSRFVLS